MSFLAGFAFFLGFSALACGLLADFVARLVLALGFSADLASCRGTDVVKGARSATTGGGRANTERNALATNTRFRSMWWVRGETRTRCADTGSLT